MCCYKIRVSIYVAVSLKHSKLRKLLWGKEGNINIGKLHLGRAIRVRRRAAKIEGTCSQRGGSTCRHQAAPRWCQPCSCASQAGSCLAGSSAILLDVPLETPKTCPAQGLQWFMALPCDCPGADHLGEVKPQLSLCCC